MKRLLCFFDGTWNKPDGRASVTNVVKLARYALGTAPDGTAQITRYFEGIGTDHGDSDTEAFLEGAIGVGIDRRVLAGYRFLAEHYDAGDEICLFGFSRGAFIARSLAGLITLVGLLRTDALDAADSAWDYYKAHRTAPDAAKLAHLRALGEPNVRIRCLGVWDTVGNLGLPLVGGLGLTEDYAFHDTELSPLVDVGLHALAIDEPRGPFAPSLWTIRKGASLPPGQIVEQVWFAGSHANVGGGFEDSALSDIALIWMAERVMATTGVAFDIAELEAAAAPDPLGELVAPTSDTLYKISHMLPFVRLIGQDLRGLASWRRRLLGTWRTSLLPEDTESVNESIHPSVVHRFGKRARTRRGEATSMAIYRPRPLAAAIAHTGLAPTAAGAGGDRLDSGAAPAAYAGHGNTAR